LVELNKRSGCRKLQGIQSNRALEMRRCPLGIPSLQIGIPCVGLRNSRFRLEFCRTFESKFGFARLLPQQERCTDRREERAVIGELRLPFRQETVASSDEFPRTAFAPDVHVRDAEIPLLQARIRLSPGGNVCIDRNALFLNWAPLNAMVGKSSVAAIFGI